MLIKLLNIIFKYKKNYNFTASVMKLLEVVNLPGILLFWDIVNENTIEIINWYYLHMFKKINDEVNLSWFGNITTSVVK